jgi:hypothetical protein
MPSRSDLTRILDDATAQLDQLIAAAAVPEDLDELLPAYDRTQKQIRDATLDFEGPPTDDETRAFAAWESSAARLQTVVKDNLQLLDGKFGDLRKARSALRAYSTLDPHHKAQRLQKKL